MQFIVIGRDGSDDQALSRRMAAREAHLALAEKMRQAGSFLFAAAILDDSEKMVGSTIICEFQSRVELDLWLKEEPYVQGDVWKEIEIKQCKVGPNFAAAKPAVSVQAQ